MTALSTSPRRLISGKLIQGREEVTFHPPLEFTRLMSYMVEATVARYKFRWQIETAFKAMKSSGFNIEDTHLRDL